MIKIYAGPTGCGKTYQAFNRLNRKMKTIYLAPCRQLVYESAMKYGNSSSSIITSDIQIGDPATSKLSFRTYEACRIEDLKDVNVLIIDEAHFMSDGERGPHLQALMSFMDSKGKTVVLLSATMNFRIPGAKVIKLPPRGSQFVKREISYSEALERAKAGVPTLVFHMRKIDCGDVAEDLGIKGGVITANTSVQDRIRLVNLFNEGKITILESTNAMAQGVNVPCENLIMVENSYDGAACFIQKMGRLGRTGVTRDNADLTYCYVMNALPKEIARIEKGRDAKAKLRKSKAQVKTMARIKNIKVKKGMEDSIPFDHDLNNPSSELDKIKTKNLIARSWRKEEKKC